jgi:carboxypeptidase Taq
MMAGKFDRDEKIKLSLDVIKRMGLKNENSRLDLVEHPMTIKVGFNDVRITTGVREDPMFTFGSTVHEAGHALYDLGMREKDKYTVLSDAPSLGMHESQSRFWEIMMSLNKPFWRFYFPKFKKAFNLNGNYDEWYKEVNFIEPSFVRIESDEVHYCLHIILRFEIEMGLIDGSIKVKDLPKIWNSKTKELFGIIPHSDKKGVLQDVHWSNGYIGYFPTYAIGTIYSTQLYSQMKKEIPEIEKDIEKGDFSKVKNWLDEKVHKYGSRYLAEDLMKKVCGEGLNPEVFINYLKEKYSEIYK